MSVKSPVCSIGRVSFLSTGELCFLCECWAGTGGCEQVRVGSTSIWRELYLGTGLSVANKGSKSSSTIVLFWGSFQNSESSVVL